MFLKEGFAVVDKRECGGCLLEIGTEKNISNVVIEVKKRYHISGNYGRDKTAGIEKG